MKLEGHWHLSQGTAKNTTNKAQHFTANQCLHNCSEYVMEGGAYSYLRQNIVARRP